MIRQPRPVRTLALAALAGALALPPVAGAAGPIVRRQDQQEERIDAGVDGGQLTSREAATLERQQDAIAQARDRAIANDGHIGTREARRLTHAQDRASRRIHALKHNGRTAPAAP